MKNRAHHYARCGQRPYLGSLRTWEMANGITHLACLIVALAVCYAVESASVGLTSNY